MRKVAGVLWTIGILAAIWGVLGAVAWIAGVLPSLPDRRTAADETPRAPDAGLAVPAEVARADASTRGEMPAHREPIEDDTSEERMEPAPPEPSAAAMHRFSLARPVSPYILSLSAGQLVGDERPEIVVGLGDRFEVLTVGASAGDAPSLTRILTIAQRSQEPGFLLSAPRAALGDVTGDGRADLVIAFWRRTEAGGSRGGGVWIAKGTRDGGLSRPTRIAGPFVMATSVSLLELDGRRGLDIVVGDRGRPWGDIPGRVRVFSGGRRHAPLTEHQATLDVRMALPAHVDGDEAVDIVAVGETIRPFRNVGRGRFEPLPDHARGILYANIPHGFSGDLDGDGKLEAYVCTNTEPEDGTLILGPAGERFVPLHYDPRNDENGLVYAIKALADVDGDDRNDALILHSVTNDWQIATFDATGAPRALRAVHGGYPRRGHDGTIVDLDADGEPELVTLDSVYDPASRTQSYELVITSTCMGCERTDRAHAIAEPSDAAHHEVR